MNMETVVIVTLSIFMMLLILIDVILTGMLEAYMDKIEEYETIITKLENMIIGYQSLELLEVQRDLDKGIG